MKVDNAPVLPNSNVVAKALGISATIPEKIINEIPLPIPLWVICSPSHIRNMVPATIVVTVEILKKAPGDITKFAEDLTLLIIHILEQSLIKQSHNVLFV